MKQVALVREGVQPIGQAVAARGRKRRAAVSMLEHRGQGARLISDTMRGWSSATRASPSRHAVGAALRALRL